jgi:phospholipid/cholesterol/gamma-HCH transport system substrate-binding protein
MRARSTKLVVGVLLGVLALTGCEFNGAYDLPLPGGSHASKGDSILITADFADVLSVVPRTAVMVDDVPIGDVTSVERVGWHARITMRVRKNLHLPANTTADIRQTSLLGEKYVALIAPAAGQAKGTMVNGANIPLASTGRNPEVEEVLGALSFLLSGGGVAQLKTISTELNNMMTGRTDNLRDVLLKVNDLVGTLDQQKNDILGAMSSIDRLASTLNKEKATIGSALDAVGPALKVLNEQHKSLIAMLSQLDKLGTVGTQVLNGSKDNIVASLKHLQPVLTKLADAGDALPNGLTFMAAFPFPKEAANIAMGDYANALFHIDFDLNDLISPADLPVSLGDVLTTCEKTPLAAICKTLDATVLTQLCALVPLSILCDRTTPGGSAGPGTGGSPGLPDLGGIGLPTLGGLLPGLLGKESTSSPGSSTTNGGLFGGGLG